MNSRKLYIPLAFSIAVAIGLLLGNKLGNHNAVASNSAAKNKLNRLLDFIDAEYVDNINTDSIVDLTVDKILQNLDPHSVYINKKDIVAVNESMRGDFVGIGINFYNYKDSIAVIKTIKNGPSEKAGIKPGDRILFANNYQLYNKNISNDTLFSKLKGEIGTEVALTVFRKSENKKLKITVTRDIIPIKSVDVALKIANKIGYIKINRFSETTFSEFHEALNKLKKETITTLLVDVRENGGGYLEMAEEIADEFLKDKELIVKTINKKGNEEISLATEKGIFEKGKLYILIDENSASASEILAGAIQDNDRGTIVGRRSFGKGLVQREIPFNDGSAVRLTVARYYTPSGRSIQKPYDDKAEGYFNEFEKRFASGELYEADSIKVADSLKYKTKKGRIVYGGGGIIPDVFVPISQNHAQEATNMIMQSGLISYFVFEELDKNRLFFEKLSQEQLKNEIFTNQKYINDLKSYASNSGLLLDYSNKDKILTYLYAEFVRQLFTDDAYYKIILQEDDMVKKVLELNNF
ncbi:S41 family peptidase [Flavobacterium sp.]|uniref:S41 family peptidase n=1 Tax=Flavobacterium sp. TaxID=239 RepID=UPI0035280EEB